jgi:hypothetical protein
MVKIIARFVSRLRGELAERHGLGDGAMTANEFLNESTNERPPFVDGLHPDRLMKFNKLLP